MSSTTNLRFIQCHKDDTTSKSSARELHKPWCGTSKSSSSRARKRRKVLMTGPNCRQSAYTLVMWAKEGDSTYDTFISDKGQIAFLGHLEKLHSLVRTEMRRQWQGGTTKICISSNGEPYESREGSRWHWHSTLSKSDWPTNLQCSLQRIEVFAPPVDHDLTFKRADLAAG